jgi:hypothetical protein
VKLKLVLVEWLDSHSGQGWQRLHEIAENGAPVLCQSVGWLVSDQKDHKVLVPHISGMGNEGVVPYGRGEISIPAKAIRKLRVLQKG